MFVSCRSRFPGARWVIAVSRVVRRRSIAGRTISIFAPDFDDFLAKENDKERDFPRPRDAKWLKE